MIPEFKISMCCTDEFTQDFPTFQELAHKRMNVNIRHEISKFNNSLQFDRLEIKNEKVYYECFQIGRVEIDSQWDDPHLFVLSYKFIPK